MMDEKANKNPSMIHNVEQSFVDKNSKSFDFLGKDVERSTMSHLEEGMDDYENDDDQGFDTIEVMEDEFVEKCQ